MKTLRKKLFIILSFALLLSVSVGLILFINTDIAMADDSPVFTINEKAEMRLQTPYSLRFTGTFNQSVYDKAFDENGEKEGVKLGMIIVPKQYVLDYNAYKAENVGYTGGYFEYFRDIKQKMNDYVFKKDLVHDNGKDYSVKACITGVLYQNLSLDFVAIGYLNENGAFTYTEVNEGRSLEFVSKACFNDDAVRETMSSETLSFIKETLTDAYYAKNGVTKSEGVYNYGGHDYHDLTEVPLYKEAEKNMAVEANVSDVTASVSGGNLTFTVVFDKPIGAGENVTANVSDMVEYNGGKASFKSAVWSDENTLLLTASESTLYTYSNSVLTVKEGLTENPNFKIKETKSYQYVGGVVSEFTGDPSDIEKATSVMQFVYAPQGGSNYSYLRFNDIITASQMTGASANAYYIYFRRANNGENWLKYTFDQVGFAGDLGTASSWSSQYSFNTIAGIDEIQFLIKSDFTFPNGKKLSYGKNCIVTVNIKNGTQSGINTVYAVTDIEFVDAVNDTYAGGKLGLALNKYVDAVVRTGDNMIFMGFSRNASQGKNLLKGTTDNFSYYYYQGSDGTWGKSYNTENVSFEGRYTGFWYSEKQKIVFTKDFVCNDGSYITTYEDLVITFVKDGDTVTVSHEYVEPGITVPSEIIVK